MIYCYSYDKATGKLSKTEDFESNETNWLIRAESGDTTIYFSSLAAYNVWTGTTCPISAHFINRVGSYKGYKLTKNY